MFKDHQENTLVGSYITTNEIESKNDDKTFPQLVESASVDENGTVYATVTNTSASKAAKIRCQVADTKVKSIKAEILTGDIHSKNDFENGDAVKTVPFTDFKLHRDGFTANIPACSVVKFVIER